ncbi:MAG: glycosyltransferase family 4 protein [Patescibacteria group bacterium]
MKILLATGIYPPESGGPATYTSGLFVSLKARGHEVDVLAYGDASLKEDHVTRVSRAGGAVVRYIRYAWQAFRLAPQADIVYAQGPVSEGFPATVGALLAGKPLMMKVVGDYAWEMAQQRGEEKLLDEFLDTRHAGVIGFYEWAERWTSRSARHVVVPSRYLATVVKRWGVPAPRISTIINAVEPLPSVGLRSDERQTLGVADKVLVLTAVRAVPWKGVAGLIEWWKELPSSHVLVVAGDGPELDHWKKRAEEYGVSDRVRFLGRIDRMTLARWYEAADVFVLDSGYEGYPHVVAEAASRGVPCLVSDRGGNPETRETFPGLVRVLPYRDRQAWVGALQAVTALQPRSIPTISWTHDDMVNTTLALLQTYAKP